MEWTQSIKCAHEYSKNYVFKTCSVCCEIDVITKTANHLKPSEVTLNQPKTTSANETPNHSTAQKLSNLTLFFCCWLWTRFLNQESRIRKKWRTSGNDHELQWKILNPFSEFCDITLKQVYNMSEWDCITYICIKSFNICFC